MVDDARLYDLIQLLAGGREIRRRLRDRISSTVAADSIVVDMGGGTASLRRSLPPSVTYACLDIDPSKLRRAAAKKGGAGALLADVTRAPLASGCADIVICCAVSHHLTDQQVRWTLDEIERLLKDGGVLLFLDAMWIPGRLLSRILWHYDRGSHPREPEPLLDMLLERFSATHCERFSVYHKYLLFVGAKS